MWLFGLFKQPVAFWALIFVHLRQVISVFHHLHFPSWAVGTFRSKILVSCDLPPMVDRKTQDPKIYFYGAKTKATNKYIFNQYRHQTNMYHFRFFGYTLLHSEKSPKKMITWNPRHGHLALYFRFLSYLFLPIYRAGIYLITHQQKANELTALKMTTKIALLVPVLHNIG